MPSCTHLNDIDGCTPTSNAIPTQILQIPCFEPDISMRIDLQIVARQPSTADAATWQQLLLIDKTAGATPTQGANINIMTPIKTLGATLWNFSVTFDTNHVNINAIGVAGTVINWFASASGMQVMGD